MTLRDIARAVRELQRARENVIEAQFVLAQQNRTILHLTRAYADLAVSWRLSMEKPEMDLRAEVDEIIWKSLDQVARLEEHIP